MKYVNILSFPVVFTALYLVYELIVSRLPCFNKHVSRVAFKKFSLWILRPWAFWAIFNIIYRVNEEDTFNNPYTFPFYANLWQRDMNIIEVLCSSLRLWSVLLWGGASILIAVIILVLLRSGIKSQYPSWQNKTFVVIGLFFAGVCLHMAAAAYPHGIEDPLRNKGSLLRPWFHSGSTMLYATPLVENSKTYTREFVELQPRLKRATIHAASHPPWGSLALYWIGLPFGAEGNTAADRLRYSIGLTLFNGLSILPLFFLGCVMFKSRSKGLLTAVLWLTMPNTIAHSTFAPDGVYAVFFHLSLLFSWLTVTSKQPDWRLSLILGLSFGLLTMLNYSWCVATTMFAVFAAIVGIKNRWTRKDVVLRGLVPLLTMTAALGIILAKYRFNYYSAYIYSYKYVASFYDYGNCYQWIMALIGGQCDLFLLMGSMVLSCFIVSCRQEFNWGMPPLQFIFAYIVLGVYIVAILAGPNAMKMEVSRCWGWVTAPALAIAANAIINFRRPFLLASLAVSTNIVTYLGMRLFMYFLG